MYYLNLDNDGYVLSVFLSPLPEAAPGIESLDGYDLSGWRMLAHRYEDGALVLDEERLAELEAKAAEEIPEAHNLERALKVLGQALVKTTDLSNDEKIMTAALFPDWVAGKHTAGEIYTISTGALWECIQDYDNAIYPDIAPGLPAWRTFHKPFHGKSREAALPWVAPSGAHDMYLVGEYMIWKGDVYLCKQDTSFTPEEYAAAWVKA